MVLVIATRNQGKTVEIIELLKHLPIQIRNLNDFGPIPDIVEDGATFDENAYKKASLTARYLGLPTLADDSGLVVEALLGAPGVHSARYAGPDADDAQRCRKLLDELCDNPNRAARFECVISIAVPNGAALTYEGGCAGEITHEPKGDQGFGFDPIFYYPPFKQTFAQMNAKDKNRISHRGIALSEVAAEMDKIIKWIKMQMPRPERVGCQGEDDDDR